MFYLEILWRISPVHHRPLSLSWLCWFQSSSQIEPTITNREFIFLPPYLREKCPSSSSGLSMLFPRATRLLWPRDYMPMVSFVKNILYQLYKIFNDVGPISPLIIFIIAGLKHDDLLIENADVVKAISRTNKTAILER